MGKKIIVVFLVMIIALFSLSACKSANNKTVSEAEKNTVSDSDSVSSKTKVTTSQTQAGDATRGIDSDAEENTVNSGKKSSTVKGETTLASNEPSESAQGDKKGSETTVANGSAKAQNDTTTASESKTDGWKQKEAGTVVKGDVRVNVAKYGSATLDEGKELIEQLAAGGLKNAKKLADKQTKSTVVYDYSGTRIGADKAEFVRFAFTVQKGTGYLITVIADKQADLDTDISYIMSNLAKLAK